MFGAIAKSPPTLSPAVAERLVLCIGDAVCPAYRKDVLNGDADIVDSVPTVWDSTAKDHVRDMATEENFYWWQVNRERGLVRRLFVAWGSQADIEVADRSIYYQELASTHLYVFVGLDMGFVACPGPDDKSGTTAHRLRQDAVTAVSNILGYGRWELRVVIDDHKNY